MSLQLCFFDTETTGLIPGDDRIIEISLLRCVDINGKDIRDPRNHKCEQMTIRLNPEGRKISDKAFEVHGITDGELIGTPSFSERVDAIEKFARNRIMIAHNAPFDMGMLQGEYRKLSKDVPFKFLCTLEMSKHYFPDRKSHSLDNICRDLGIAKPAKHSAKDDVIALYTAFYKMGLDQHLDEVLRRSKPRS